MHFTDGVFGIVFLFFRLFRRPVFLVSMAVFILGAALSAFGLASYTDPPGYPESWPSSLTTQAYTSQGQTQSDLSGNSDSSSGANPSGAVDFSSGTSGTDPSFYYYGNGSTLFFRLRVGSTPLALTGNSQPFSSGTWNILFDTDGDGYKEFVVMIEGVNVGQQPDDIVVIYDNNPSQKFIIGQAGIWRQDSAGSNDGADGAAGASTMWDLNPDPYIWDFGRSRVVQIDTSLSPGHNNSEYFLDFQVPISALDASLIGGPALAASSFFTLAATSSNSNSDPTQKDIIYSGDFALGDVPIPSGDISNGNGQVLMSPLIRSITATPCPSPITLNANVLDAITVDPVTKQAKDTLASVTFEYFFDANQNGLPDDEGNSWITIGSASRTTTLGIWQYSWDAGVLINGHYIIRAIAVDNQANTTVSTSQPYFSPTSVTAVFMNQCSRIALFDTSTKLAADLNGGQAVPGDTLSYTITLKNTGQLDAFNVALRDTIPAYTTYITDSASPSPVLTSPALVWNVGTIAPGATVTYTFRVLITGPIPNGTEILNSGWITYDSGQATGLTRMVTASVTVSSGPQMSFTKSVSKSAAVPGETLIYTVDYANIGTDTAMEVWISDVSPPDTEYIANSVILNGVVKTDVSDGDEVTVTSGSVIIHIGAVPAGASGQVQFQVIIK